jgi:hypothetical protein
MNRRVAKDALKVTFDPTLKLEFHGTKVTRDAGANAPISGDFGNKFRKRTLQIIVIRGRF